MELISLPDAVAVHKHLTPGKTYEVTALGNGYVIKTDNGDSCWILKERFK